MSAEFVSCWRNQWMPPHIQLFCLRCCWLSKCKEAQTPPPTTRTNCWKGATRIDQQTGKRISHSNVIFTVSFCRCCAWAISFLTKEENSSGYQTDILSGNIMRPWKCDLLLYSQTQFYFICCCARAVVLNPETEDGWNRTFEGRPDVSIA